MRRIKLQEASGRKCVVFACAAALLFCYDPPVEVGRDGRPRKHYLERHGKAFMATFKTLLNEVGSGRR